MSRMADIFRERAERLAEERVEIQPAEVFRTTGADGSVLVALKPDELAWMRLYWARKNSPLLVDASAREEAA